MRIVLIGTEQTPLGPALAERLHLPHLRGVDEIDGDGFVLDGAPHDVAEARALDAVLRLRAAEVDAVLWVRGGAADREAVLDHYFGKVIELQPADLLGSAMEGLREVLVAA
ncbi:MAG: hypothetical protein R2717_01470 [Schumannella sp.]|nr:hypothetical protein [Microbacteriaceae bacterium]